MEYLKNLDESKLFETQVIIKSIGQNFISRLR